MKKHALLIICLLFSLTGCAKPSNSNIEGKSEESDFCLINRTTDGIEITRQYFKYKNDDNSDSNCSDYYLRIDNQVKYGDISSEDGDNEKIGNVDLTTFKALNKEISKDKNSVYMKGKRVDMVLDPFSFEILSNSSYAKDNKTVYVIDINDEIQVVDEADSETFEAIGSIYGKDKNNVYYDSKKIEGADSASFKIKNITGYYDNFGRDKEHLYYYGELVEEADPNTFEKIDEYYFKDKNYVFHKIEDYNAPVKIEGSDSPTYEFLNSNYAKDKNNVYFNGEIVEGADPITFEVEDGEYFAKDKNNLYVGAQKRDKNSVIRNFIEAYLTNERSIGYDLRDNFKENEESINVSNANGEIILKIIHQNDFDNITCSYQGGTSELGCIPRAEEEFFENMEKELKSNFPTIKSLTIIENGELTYKDQKYYREKAILGLSEDGRYVEMGFENHGPGPNTFCVFADMKTGECIFNPGYDFIHDSDEIVRQRYDEIRKKYHISSNFDKTAGYMVPSSKINKEVELFGKSFAPKMDINDGYFDNWTNLNLKHLPTGLEVTVLTQDMNYHKIYGHRSMQGVILLTWWNWEADAVYFPTVISQDLLDQKLAELYNDVGMHYYDEKDYQTAIGYFDKALEINKDYAQVYYNKACTQSLMNNADGTILSLKKAIELEPVKFKEKARADKDFDGLRENNQFNDLIK